MIHISPGEDCFYSKNRLLFLMVGDACVLKNKQAMGSYYFFGHGRM